MAFGARHMATSLFHLATRVERTLIRRHNEPLRANHIIFGANWHQLALAQWTPSIRQQITINVLVLNINNTGIDFSYDFTVCAGTRRRKNAATRDFVGKGLY